MTVDTKRTSSLYSTNPFVFYSRETLLSGDGVFVGNQLDDFGVCGGLTNGNRILILGTGYGGAFRSVIAGIENAEVIALDYDQNILDGCKSMMSSFFPELDQISYVHGDASKLTEHVEGLFDVICVDVYSSQGYPPFVFESTFWQRLMLRRRDAGTR